MAATRSAKPKRSVGRPRAGLKRDAAVVDRVRDYRTFTVRLPEELRAYLEAIATLLNKPMWRTVYEVVYFYVENRLKRDLPSDYGRVRELAGEFLEVPRSRRTSR